MFRRIGRDTLVGVLAILFALGIVAGVAGFGGNSNAQVSKCITDLTALNQRQNLGLTKAQIDAQCATAPSTTVPATIPRATTTTAAPSATTTTVGSTTTVPATTAATTSTTTGPAPTAPPTNVAPPATMCLDHEMHAGDVYLVKTGCHVKGDVQVSSGSNGPWTPLYRDSDPKTGTLVDVQQDSWFFAQWGANVSERTLDDMEAEMKASGCVGGCTIVHRVVWPSGTSFPTTTTASYAVSTTVATVPVTALTSVDPMTTTPITIAFQATTAVVTNMCDISLPKGSKALVPAGCVVSGDVATSSSGANGTWKVRYDSEQATGLVVVVQNPTWFFAPYGASVTNANPADVVDAVRVTGCGLPSGCASVKTVTV